MATDYDFADDLEQWEQEQESVVTFNGTDYPCIHGAVTLASSLGFGGYSPDADLVMVCRFAVFSGVTPPALQDLVTIRNRQYRIDKIDVAPAETFFVATLIHASKNA